MNTETPKPAPRGHAKPNPSTLRLKIVCAVLALALIVALTRVFVLAHGQHSASAPTESTSAVVLSNILQRKSVRSYTDEPVSREALDTLVRAAMAAPTAKDMRPWKFVIIDDTTVLRAMAAELPRAKMLSDAPAAIVVCGDHSVVDDKGEPSRYWDVDCAAATENLLLQAEAMDLGAVWTAAYPNDDRVEVVKRVLALPDHITPLCVVPVGHPKGEQTPKDKYTKDNIHFNKW